MWAVGLCLVAIVVAYCSYWLNKWRNPKCTGVLPPGSMGLPFVGDSSVNCSQYGPIFRTSVAGRPIVISIDAEFNHYIVKQEGKLLFSMEGENRTTALGIIYKYVKSIILDHFVFASKTLEIWSTQFSVEVKHVASIMVFDFSAKSIIFSYDAERLLRTVLFFHQKSPMKLSEKLINVVRGFMSVPLNIPRFAYHKSLKDQKEALTMSRKIEKFLSEVFLSRWVFGISFATFEAISTALSLALKLIMDNPTVLQELTNPNSILTWVEYKSMTFTLQVINEVFRIANVSPGLLRKALKDIKFKGYTIPAGWTIMLVNSALQLNSNTYKDPLAFNPWRWKDLDPSVLSKNFMPFGGGIRQCAGAEYTKTFMAIFLHVLVTKYRWIKVKGGKIARSPILIFTDGLHVNFSKKNNI
ncbi:hypothetical protein ACB092_07G198200 [Castanea dentata]